MEALCTPQIRSFQLTIADLFKRIIVYLRDSKPQMLLAKQRNQSQSARQRDGHFILLPTDIFLFLFFPLVTSVETREESDEIWSENTLAILTRHITSRGCCWESISRWTRRRQQFYLHVFQTLSAYFFFALKEVDEELPSRFQRTKCWLLLTSLSGMTNPWNLVILSSCKNIHFWQ